MQLDLPTYLKSDVICECSPKHFFYFIFFLSKVLAHFKNKYLLFFLGHSIEVSYSNMQRLVLKYLHTVSQAVNFHLAEIIGHVRASDKYESVLKFSEDAIKQAQTKASIFWAKGIELQQVNNSVDIFIIIHDSRIYLIL